MAARCVLACLTVAILRGTGAVALPVHGDAAFAKAAAAAVEKIEREDGFSGSILVARGNQVLLRTAAGFADRERKILNVPETQFPLMSVTKQFTAAGIMLLVQDGKISLSDGVSKYYSASPRAWNDITIKHLLNHGSGIRDVSEVELRAARSNEDIVRFAAESPLRFTPGSNFEYSNSGYALLAAVIEHVSGQRFGDFLRSRVFAPLGMRASGYGTIPAGNVRGYVRSLQGNWQIGQPVNLDVLGGEGGLYSTVDDMLRWSSALYGDKFLSKASQDAIFADYGYNYGFGWRFATKYNRRLIWHTGNFTSAGFASIVDRFPEEELTVIALTNNTGITNSTATLVIGGQVTTFQAGAVRKAVEEVERLYFSPGP